MTSRIDKLIADGQQDDHLRALERQNRALAILDQLHEAMLTLRDPLLLFEAACRIAVEAGGFMLACVRLLDETSGTMRPVAQWGEDNGYLSMAPSASAESPLGMGPSGHAVREGQHFFCNDIQNDERMRPWRDDALKRGFRTSAAFPLLLKSRVIGALSVYSGQAGFFDEAELTLLDRLGGRLSFALETSARDAQRRRAEEALRQSEERYRATINAIDDRITVKDLSERFLVVNDAQVAFYGQVRDEVLGRTTNEVHSPILAREHSESDLLVLQNGITVEREQVRLSAKDQAERTFNVRKTPLKDSSGTVVGVVTVSRDITEWKMLQQQLLRAQRLETAGKIAGQVAHDFNNLLGPMVAYPELIKMTLPAGHPGHEYCDDMLQAAQAMAEINTDMLALSRRGLLRKEPVDVNEVVRQALAQADANASGLEVSTVLAGDLLAVSGSGAQLLRVFSNLISNGCDAMVAGGRLKVTTENIYLDEPAGRFNRIDKGEYVKVTVQDTGIGIAPGIRDKIFDAFFTTKTAAKRRGSGLGLAVVQALVEDHGGRVDLESEVGRGSTFHVFLPAERVQTGVAADESIPKGHERVLVVDDDPIQRRVEEQMLAALGYGVQSAGSGEEAIALLRTTSVDLVILDMVMPGGIDGSETLRRLRETNPSQRALVASGYSESDRVREALQRGASSFLRKPLSMARLARAVREALDR